MNISKFFVKNIIKKSIDLDKINYFRAKKRLNDFIDILKNTNFINDIKQMSKNGNSYIDIGASDGYMTYYVGVNLGFGDDKIHATDILDPPRIMKCNYTKTDGLTLNYDDQQFSFITLFQSLHHMTHLESMMNEICRISKPGTILFIREHDLGPTNLHTLYTHLFKLEHAFYEILFDGVPYDDFEEKYYAEYGSKNEWREVFEFYGYEELYTKRIDKFNPTNYYYGVYKLSKNAPK